MRQLKGDDTSLVVAHPLGVPTDKAVYAEARAQDGRLLSLVPTTSVPKGLLFEYRKLVSGEPVDHYWLPTWPQIYLPLILRR